MNCFNHPPEAAVATCVHCGRAMCPACAAKSSGLRIVCPGTCEAALALGAETVSLLLGRSAQSAKASAVYCHLSGALSAAAAVAAWFMLPSPFLIGFTAACALVLFAAGFWYGRVAR